MDVSDGSWIQSGYNTLDLSTQQRYRYAGVTRTVSYAYSDRDNLPLTATFYGGGGKVTNCYNTGSVSGSYNVGGIAGLNSGEGKTVNCYNTGNVTGDDSVGGIVGQNMNNGKVTDCYNTGNVSGNNSFGGVVSMLSLGIRIAPGICPASYSA